MEHFIHTREHAIDVKRKGMWKGNGERSTRLQEMESSVVTRWCVLWVWAHLRCHPFVTVGDFFSRNPSNRPGAPLRNSVIVSDAEAAGDRGMPSPVPLREEREWWLDVAGLRHMQVYIDWTNVVNP